MLERFEAVHVEIWFQVSGERFKKRNQCLGVSSSFSSFKEFVGGILLVKVLPPTPCSDISNNTSLLQH